MRYMGVKTTIKDLNGNSKYSKNDLHMTTHYNTHVRGHGYMLTPGVITFNLSLAQNKKYSMHPMS